MQNGIEFSNILLKMSDNTTLDDKINKEIFDNLEYFYSNNDRHYYHEISKIILSQEDDEINDIIQMIAEHFINFSEQKKSPHVKKYKKLYDHIMLAIGQKKFIEDHLRDLKSEHEQTFKSVLSSISETSATIEDIANKSSKQDDNLIRQNNKLKTLEEQSKKITTNFVAILGIFSSVIFAAFGGLEILKNILGSIQYVHTGKLLLFSSLTIGAIVFLVFLLLSGISKLTGLDLKSCNCGSEDDCDCGYAKKYPSLVIAYIVLLYIALAGITGYFIDYNMILSEIINGKKAIYILNGIIALSLIYFITTFIAFKLYREKS